MIIAAAAIILCSLATLVFSTLTYSLRDFSRARLTALLEEADKARWIEPTIEHTNDLIFVTAVGRLVFNILMLLSVMRAFHHGSLWVQYLASFAITGIMHLFFSVAIPHAVSQHAGEAFIATFAPFLHGLRYVLLPVTRVMHWIDALVARIAGTTHAQQEQIEQDIVSVVEEGVKEGVVDEQEREMIESVIEFRDTQVGQIMTARPEIVAIEIHATLETVKQTLEESGHSRLPVYDGTLDHVIGMLYARDLLKHLGEPPEKFNIRSAMRPAIFVPETKALRDLLREFRMQKVHIGIVLDEYGGTAGLVTIEDILEELVGEITDEHEPVEPKMVRKIDDHTFEADARLSIEDANSQMGLDIPTEDGTETIGGFVSITLGQIPAKGAVMVHDNVRYTVIDAQPQRVNRLKIERIAQASPVGASAG